MSKKNHSFHANTVIKMYVSTGYVGSQHEEEDTLEAWTGISDPQSRSLEDVEKAIDDACQEFIWNHIDSSWEVADEGNGEDDEGECDEEDG